MEKAVVIGLIRSIAECAEQMASFKYEINKNDRRNPTFVTSIRAWNDVCTCYVVFDKWGFSRVGMSPICFIGNLTEKRTSVLMLDLMKRIDEIMFAEQKFHAILTF